MTGFLKTPLDKKESKELVADEYRKKRDAALIPQICLGESAV
jgi:hypothetical protein